MIAPKGSKPVRAEPLVAPRPQRRFPFRLLLWALLMTATTAGASYYAYQFYKSKESARKAEGHATKDKADVQALLTDCTDAVGAKTTELQTLGSTHEVCTADLTTAKTELKALNDKATPQEKELRQLQAQKAKWEQHAKSIAKFREEFETLVKAGELKLRARRGALVVSLDSEILFESASAQLSRKGEIAVLQVGGILKNFPDRRFMVLGHTDKAPLKSNQYKDNWDLSMARALTVTRYLIEAGMKPENVLAAGAGETDPVDDKSFAKNRRIEIALLPALSELPPLPEGLEDVK